MKEIKSIIRLYDTLKGSGERCAIAQVVRVEESSYRREGARMLVFESGVFEGGISGGCLEGDALQRSQLAILKQRPSVVTYDTSKEKEIGVGLGCNGIIDVLISPITEQAPMMRMLQKCISERREHMIATVTAIHGRVDVELGDSFYIDRDSGMPEQCSNENLKNFIGQRVREVKKSKKSRIFHSETEGLPLSIFIELIPPPFHLVVYGDNYDVYPLFEIAKVLDWDVSLVGNVQKLDKAKLRSVRGVYPKDAEPRPIIDERTAVLLMAHDYKTDSDNLLSLIKGKAPYIGALGPKKRFDKMLKEYELAGRRFSDMEMERIFAPCGLEIGANTPEEIATSIFSEILAVFSEKEGGMLRDKMGPIHARF